MDKNNGKTKIDGKMKMNDKQLNAVSGGGEYNPFDLDGDGYMDMCPVLHCSNCSWSGDNPKYRAGDECPLCHIGILF